MISDTFKEVGSMARYQRESETNELRINGIHGIRQGRYYISVWVLSRSTGIIEAEFKQKQAIISENGSVIKKYSIGRCRICGLAFTMTRMRVISF